MHMLAHILMWGKKKKNQGWKIVFDLRLAPEEQMYFPIMYSEPLSEHVTELSGS